MKNPFDEILSCKFDLGTLKVNRNMSDKSQKTIKRTHIINHI